VTGIWGPENDQHRDAWRVSQEWAREQRRYSEDRRRAHRFHLLLRGMAVVCAAVLILVIAVKNADARKVRWHTSHASVFDAIDLGGDVACGSFYGGLIVAHKYLPCGTRVRFLYRGRKRTARVADRGPFIAGRTWDLDVRLQRALGFPFGVGPIQWRIPK